MRDKLKELEEHYRALRIDVTNSQKEPTKLSDKQAEEDKRLEEDPWVTAMRNIIHFT
jgi:hypothetical protein